MGLQPVFDNIHCMSACVSQISEALEGYEDRVILCRETAADFIPISNMNIRSHLIVYSPSQISIPEVSVCVIQDCFSSKIYGRLWGFYVTSAEQTIADMLEMWPHSDSSVLMPALANYYYKHSESFSDLAVLLNGKARKNFEFLKEGAVTYYDY